MLLFNLAFIAPRETVHPQTSLVTVSTTLFVGPTSFKVVDVYTIDSNGSTHLLAQEWWTFAPDNDGSPTTPPTSISSTSSLPVTPITSATTTPTSSASVTSEASLPRPSVEADTQARQERPEAIAIIVIGTIVGVAVLAGLGWLVHYCRRRAHRPKTKLTGEGGNSPAGQPGERFEKPELEANTRAAVRTGGEGDTALRGIDIDTEGPQLPPVELEAPLHSAAFREECGGENQEETASKEGLIEEVKELEEKRRACREAPS